MIFFIFFSIGDDFSSIQGLLNKIFANKNCVAITTYDNIRIYQNILAEKKWYAYLDGIFLIEGSMLF